MGDSDDAHAPAPTEPCTGPPGFEHYAQVIDVGDYDDVHAPAPTGPPGFEHWTQDFASYPLDIFPPGVYPLGWDRDKRL